MSVWTKIQSKALYKDVDMEILEEALLSMNLTLDHNVKEIENSYGKSKVDAMILNKNKATTLGIVKNLKGGITLVGDTWRSGIVGDKQADLLMNLISQNYQKTKVKKTLELEGWNVKEIKKEDKIVLECLQY